MTSSLVLHAKAAFPDIDIPDTLCDAELFSALRYRYAVSESRLQGVLKALAVEALPHPEYFMSDPDCPLKPQQSKFGYIFPLFIENDTAYVATSNPYWDGLKTDNQYCKTVQYRYCPESILAHKVIEQFETPLHWLLSLSQREHCSDIHLHSQEFFCQIKIRVGGHLLPLCAISMSHYNAILNIIKLRAHLPIGPQMTPQDGRLLDPVTRLSYRVSTLPTPFGEDIALRKMATSHAIPNLVNLGFSNDVMSVLDSISGMDSGLVLVTGPTGSGKTTTLYALINEINTTHNKMIVTLENPVEQILPGVRQSQIHGDQGYTFGDGLRAVLRQDPDVILIGEIRDDETARTALNAAHTGHLVVASIHTSNCLNTLMRLKTFNCDPFLVSHSLRAIISQKLLPSKTIDGKRTLITEALHIISTPRCDNWSELSETILEDNRYISFDQDLKCKHLQGIMGAYDI